MGVVATLIVLVGLPGSGKTCYRRQALAYLPEEQVADDFHRDAYGDSPRTHHSKHYGRIFAALRAGNDSMISDIAFCDSRRLNNVLNAFEADLPGQVDFDVRYFAKDLESCKTNINTRNDAGKDRDLKALDEFAPGYCPPQTAMDVYAPIEVITRPPGL